MNLNVEELYKAHEDGNSYESVVDRAVSMHLKDLLTNTYDIFCYKV